jgi:molybdate/tungstate transport system substrate-binding protein
MFTFRTSRSRLAVAGIALVGLAAAAGCSSSSSSSSSSSAPAASSAAPSSAAPSSAASSTAAAASCSGSVYVFYAGSLVNLITKQVGPAFQQSSGCSVTGQGAGSTALVTTIKGKTAKGDVFISASPKATATLMGAANDDWVSWYASYASSDVVLGYNPKSKFASDIKSKPWYQAITEPGLKLGFTDPATDPKGKLVAQGLSDTAKAKKLPALTAIENNKGDVFPEETLVARLQSGQLDAAFFYTAEAIPAKIPTVPLAGETLKATYTISTLKGAPNETGAEAFIAYLLGPSGQAFLKQDGFDLITPPKTTGTGIPATVSAALK